jgi:hypothetical protein
MPQDDESQAAVGSMFLHALAPVTESVSKQLEHESEYATLYLPAFAGHESGSFAQVLLYGEKYAFH